MATTLDTYAPYDAGAGADSMEATWRKMMRRVLETGVIAHVTNEFNVFADSTGMQVKVSTGECWIQGQWGESTAQKTLAIASNSSGSTRGDRVILRNDFVNNRIELDVLTGVSATPPAVTQDASKWEISLATVSIPNADASIDAGQVTDDRQWTHIPGNPLEFWAVQTVQQTGLAASTWNTITFTAESSDRQGWHSTSSNTSRVTPNKQGWYWVAGTAAMSISSGQVVAAIAKNGTRVAGFPSNGAAGADPGVSGAHANGLIFLNGTTDYVELQEYHPGSSAPTAVTTDLCSSLYVEFRFRG